MIYKKDKTIGFKILHLGAKKFSHEPDYMLAYIKYMYHLNGWFAFWFLLKFNQRVVFVVHYLKEDNNTRVLFERILSSEDLPPHKTKYGWNQQIFLKIVKFLIFKNNLNIYVFLIFQRNMVRIFEIWVRCWRLGVDFKGRSEATKSLRSGKY